jgi:uncharacterized protein YjbI with pentapeptide repeats
MERCHPDPQRALFFLTSSDVYTSLFAVIKQNHKWFFEITSNDQALPDSICSEQLKNLADVEQIRYFFDEKTNYIKADKLSQSYVSASFTEDDARYCHLSLDNLRLMFRSYCEDPSFSPSLELPKESWKFWEGEKRTKLNNWCKNRPRNIIRPYLKKQVLKYGIATTVIGILANSIFNLSGVEKQKYFQAWQVISAATGQSGLGGRNEALEYLNSRTFVSFLNWGAPKCKRDNNCLVGIEINKANLKRVNLESANLDSSVFYETNFRYANLKNTVFTNAELQKSVFKGAILHNVKFIKSNLANTVFTEAPPSQGDLKDYDMAFKTANLDKSELYSVNFTSSMLENVSFKEANLKGSNFANAKLKGAIFTGANLNNANFKNAQLDDKALDDAKLCNTVMKNGGVSKRDCITEGFR